MIAAGADRDRLAKLFGRLGSDQAGERDSALAAIEKALAAAGSSWSWICALVGRGRLPDDADQAARDGLLDQLVEQLTREAMFGAWALSVEERAALTRVSAELRETRSVAALRVDEIRRVIEVADIVRKRVGRRW